MVGLQQVTVSISGLSFAYFTETLLLRELWSNGARQALHIIQSEYETQVELANGNIRRSNASQDCPKPLITLKF